MRHLAGLMAGGSEKERNEKRRRVNENWPIVKREKSMAWNFLEFGNIFLRPKSLDMLILKSNNRILPIALF